MAEYKYNKDACQQDRPKGVTENGNEIILNVRTISSKLLSSVSEKRGFLSGVIDGSMSRQHVTAVCRQI